MRKILSLLMFAISLFAVRTANAVIKEGITPSSELLNFKAGEQWEYQVTMTVPVITYLNLGGYSVPIHHNQNIGGWNLEITVFSVPEGNGPTKLGLLEHEFKNSNNAANRLDRTDTCYIQQDSEGLEINKDNDVELVYPKIWQIGTVFNSVPILGTGIETDISTIFQNTVTNPEKVVVKAGKFIAWKVSRLDTENTLGYNLWIAPEIGLPIRLSETVNAESFTAYAIGQLLYNRGYSVHYGDIIYHIEYRLIKTNVGEKG